MQNKLQLAMASLPEVVQRSGVKVSKSTRNYLIIVGLVSEDGSMDGNDLHDYAQSNLEKVLARGARRGRGRRTSARSTPCASGSIPSKLTDYGLTIEDVVAGAADLQRGGLRRPVRRRAGRRKGSV